MPNTANKTQGPARRERRRRGRHAPFFGLRNEIDDMFSHYFAPMSRGRDESDAFAMPTKLDVSETKNTINVTLDVPGIDEKDLEISLAEGVLEVTGHREEEAEEKEADFHRIERTYGSFQRRIALPCEVDDEKIDAKLKKGVLKIKLPKSAKAKQNGRKIAITSS